MFRQETRPPVLLTSLITRLSPLPKIGLQDFSPLSDLQLQSLCPRVSQNFQPLLLLTLLVGVASPLADPGKTGLVAPDLPALLPVQSVSTMMHTQTNLSSGIGYGYCQGTSSAPRREMSWMSESMQYMKIT